MNYVKKLLLTDYGQNQLTNFQWSRTIQEFQIFILFSIRKDHHKILLLITLGNCDLKSFFQFAVFERIYILEVCPSLIARYVLQTCQLEKDREHDA